MKNKYLSFVIDAILSGVFLAVGCTVYLSIESKALGAFMFSLGLFAIVTFKFGLYTGKAGYMAVNPPSYIVEVIVTFAGNVLGTAIGGLALGFTHFGQSLVEKATIVMNNKLTDSSLSIFILAIFCGVLMYTAVEGNKRCMQQKNFIGGLFAIVLPVMVFISCGFNHCVADSAYFFVSRCANAELAPKYFALAVLGNAVGCMFIPMMKKLSNNP